jgi:hypothetical protein
MFNDSNKKNLSINKFNKQGRYLIDLLRNSLSQQQLARDDLLKYINKKENSNVSKSSAGINEYNRTCIYLT